MTVASRTCPPQPLLPDIVGRLARVQSESPAYVDEDGTVTWRELDAVRRSVAGAMATSGLRPGERAGIIATDRLELLEHWHACLLGGFVRVGINWRYSAREMDHLVQDGDLRLIVIEDRFLSDLGPVVETWRSQGRVLVGIGADHGLEHDFAALRAHPPAAPPVLAPEDLAAVSYTSGTTGWPKGAMITHGSAGIALFATALGAGLRSDDVVLNNLPGSGFPIFIHSHAIAVGAMTVLPGRYSADRALDLIAAHGVTVMVCVPTMLHGIVERARERGITDTSLRTVITMGSPSVPAVAQRARATLGCELQNWYGSTEAVGAVCQLRGWDGAELVADPATAGRCVGRPMAHVDLEIRDPNGGVLAPGRPGEVCVRGAVMTGYFGRPAETEAALRGGWLHTGDVGFQDEHGFVYITDRIDFMIISGGYNVYPAVVENVVAEHPDVGEVAVIGAAHEKWGEAVVAVVVPSQGRHVDTEDVLALCARHLGRWEVPKQIDVVDVLPVGTTGKVQKREIRSWYHDRPDRLSWNAVEGTR